jgi:hypothetical protein
VRPSTPPSPPQKAGESAALRKMKVLMWTSGGSFLFETFKWFFQGSDYSALFPSLGGFDPRV